MSNNQTADQPPPDEPHDNQNDARPTDSESGGESGEEDASSVNLLKSDTEESATAREQLVRELRARIDKEAKKRLRVQNYLTASRDAVKRLKAQKIVQATELQAKLDAEKSKVRSLKREYEEEVADRKSFEKRLRTQVEDEIFALKARSREQSKRAGNAEKETKKKEKDIEKYSKEHDRLRRSLSSLRSDFTTAAHERDGWRVRCKAAEKEVAKLQESLREKHRERSDCNLEIERLRNERKKLDAENMKRKEDQKVREAREAHELKLKQMQEQSRLKMKEREELGNKKRKEEHDKQKEQSARIDASMKMMIRNGSSSGTHHPGAGSFGTLPNGGMFPNHPALMQVSSSSSVVVNWLFFTNRFG